MPPLQLEPSTTALVLIDLQRGITASPTLPHSTDEVIARAGRLVRRCREHGMLIILVHVDPGPKGELFPSPETDIPRIVRATTPDWTEIVPELGPEPEDVVVTKHQPSAFYGTDIEIHLRRRGIRTILLGGISTNIGVEATARAAHERGYEQIFVEDAMAARGAELHAFPVTRLFPTIGRVRSTQEVLDALG
jgi:nicotinamidase-related amidase